MDRCTMTSRFAAWRVLLMCILFSLTPAAHAQPDTTAHNVPPAMEAGVASLEAGATSREQTASGLAETNAPAVHELSPDDGREDLTAFFSIGIAIDVLLLTVFAVWAVRQWRKPRK